MAYFNIKDIGDRNKLRQEQAFYIAETAYRNMGKFLHIPETYVTADGYPLGSIWKELQDAYKQNQLTTDEIKFLIKLRMLFGDDPHKDLETWIKRADEVEDYYNKNGTLSMPNTTLFSDRASMFQWVHHQKRLNKNDELSAYQKDRLENMGIQWIEQEPDWETGYQHAEQFYDENGHLFVDEQYMSHDRFKLGHWIEEQRKRYLGKSKHEINGEQIEMLEDIGMFWEDLENAEWDWFVGLLREFIKKTSKPFIIRKDFKYKNYPLGERVYEVIEQYLNGTLSEEKIKQLTKIGFKFRRRIE